MNCATPLETFTLLLDNASWNLFGLILEFLQLPCLNSVASSLPCLHFLWSSPKILSPACMSKPFVLGYLWETCPQIPLIWSHTQRSQLKTRAAYWMLFCLEYLGPWSSEGLSKALLNPELWIPHLKRPVLAQGTSRPLSTKEINLPHRDRGKG